MPPPASPAAADGGGGGVPPELLAELAAGGPHAAAACALLAADHSSVGWGELLALLQVEPRSGTAAALQKQMQSAHASQQQQQPRQQQPQQRQQQPQQRQRQQHQQQQPTAELTAGRLQQALCEARSAQTLPQLGLIKDSACIIDDTLLTLQVSDSQRQALTWLAAQAAANALCLIASSRSSCSPLILDSQDCGDGLHVAGLLVLAFMAAAAKQRQLGVTAMLDAGLPRLLNQACAVTAIQLQAFRLQGTMVDISSSSTAVLLRLRSLHATTSMLSASVTSAMSLAHGAEDAAAKQDILEQLVDGPASLALAAMQLGAQCGTEQPDSSSGSNSGSSAIGMSLLEATQDLCEVAASWLRACCLAFRGALFAGVQMPAALAQLLSLHFAALTAVQHSKAVAAAAAEPGAAQQQQQQQQQGSGCAVPAHHVRLLQELPHWERLLAAYNVRLPTGAAQPWELSMEQALALVPAMELQLPQWQRGAVLRVLVEASMLCCGRLPLQVSVLECLATVLAGLGDTTCIARRSSSSNSSSGRHGMKPAQRAGDSERLHAVQAAALLRPVLHQVAAAVLRTLRLSTAAEQGSSAAVDGVRPDAQQLKTVQSLACVVIWVASAVQPKHLAAAAFTSGLGDPLLSCAALELAVRMWGAGLLLDVPLPSTLHSGAEAMLAGFAAHIAEAVDMACSSGLVSSYLAAMQQQEQQLQEQQQAEAVVVAGLCVTAGEAPGVLQHHLLSLLCSTLKAARCCEHTPGRCWAPGPAAAPVAAAVYRAAAAVRSEFATVLASGGPGAAAEGSPDDSSSSSSSSTWLAYPVPPAAPGGTSSGVDGSAPQAAAAPASCTSIHWLALMAASMQLAASCGTAAFVAAWAASDQAATAPLDGTAYYEAVRQCMLGLGAMTELLEQSMEGNVTAVDAAGAAGKAAVAALEACSSSDGSSGSSSSQGASRPGKVAADTLATVRQQKLEQCVWWYSCSELLTHLATSMTRRWRLLEDELEDISRLMTQASNARTAAVQGQRGAHSRRANNATAQQTEAAADAPAAVVQRTTEFLSSLQAYSGELAAGLPLPTLCCNNPACANMCGLSEQQLVGGGGSGLCAGCSTARYCSRACQAQHWPQHRAACIAFREAEGEAVAAFVRVGLGRAAV